MSNIPLLLNLTLYRLPVPVLLNSDGLKNQGMAEDVSRPCMNLLFPKPWLTYQNARKAPVSMGRMDRADAVGGPAV